ncbi:hypothetical protein [Cupriavidus sp. H18C1]|uniref:hypothetical protein n=1 Tax=Cupriavidus sp. H18C1 TaxID=3241601 RepID=UPI003BB987E8
MELARRGIAVMLVESGGETFQDEAQAMCDAELADARRHATMQDAVRRAFGGTSWLWGGRCIPLRSDRLRTARLRARHRLADPLRRAVALLCARLRVHQLRPARLHARSPLRRIGSPAHHHALPAGRRDRLRPGALERRAELRTPLSRLVRA